MSCLPASPSRRSSSLTRTCVSPKTVEMPRICNSGLRSANTTAKASSTSSPMSVSMIIFSGEFCGGDWPYAAVNRINKSRSKIAVGQRNICTSLSRQQYSTKYKKHVNENEDEGQIVLSLARKAGHGQGEYLKRGCRFSCHFA